MTPAQTPLALTRRARRMHRVLAETHPDAHCELDFGNPLELAVATILSAQCTDKRVNEVTPKVFARYPAAADFAAADRTELEEMIKPAGFFRNKTESLIKLGQALTERHGGEVPGTLVQLVKLPGIGRKTANVILGNAFGVPGITVDTHFSRLVRRFGWTTEQDPVKIEFAVADLFQKRDWTMLSHRVIFHGRRVCHSRRPACGACTLAKLCPSYGLGPPEPAAAVKLLKGPRVAELANAVGLGDLVPDVPAAPTAPAAPAGATRPAATTLAATGPGAAGSGAAGSGVVAATADPATAVVAGDSAGPATGAGEVVASSTDPA